MSTKRKPTHPGLVLKHDVLEPLNLTVTEAARRLGVTRKTLSELINCRASLSPEMAIRIGNAMSMGALKPATNVRVKTSH